MTFPWFRAYADMRSDPKLAMLAFEDQRHFVWILTLKCDGTLDQFSGDFLDRVVAKQLGLDLATAGEVKRRLMEVCLIDDGWQPMGWDKRQYVSDKSADRTRKWRENKKKESGDGGVTSQQRHSDGPDTDTDTDTEKKGRNGKRFSPPTLEEVRAYCQERGKGVDAQRWHDFYSAKGWMVGRNKMKDWRAAVRTWEQKSTTPGEWDGIV